MSNDKEKESMPDKQAKTRDDALDAIDKARQVVAEVYAAEADFERSNQILNALAQIANAMQQLRNIR